MGWQKQGTVNSYTPVLHACVRDRHAAIEVCNEKWWGSPTWRGSKAELAFAQASFPLNLAGAFSELRLMPQHSA